MAAGQLLDGGRARETGLLHHPVLVGANASRPDWPKRIDPGHSALSAPGSVAPMPEPGHRRFARRALAADLAPAGRVTTPDGVGIAYYDLGGSGPPLLLAHATGFCGPVLGPMAAHLRPAVPLHRPRRACPRGLGPSTGRGLRLARLRHRRARRRRPPRAGASLRVRAFVRGRRPPARRGGPPGTFAGLYCFEPVVYPGDDPLAPTIEGNPLAAGALRRRQEFGSRREAIANFAGKAPFDRLHPDALAAYVDNGFAPVDGGGIRLRCRREHEAQVYAHALSHDAYAHLAEVQCPVTLACGAETDGFGPDLLEAFAQRLAQPDHRGVPRHGALRAARGPRRGGGLGAAAAWSP